MCVRARATHVCVCVCECWVCLTVLCGVYTIFFFFFFLVSSFVFFSLHSSSCALRLFIPLYIFIVLFQSSSAGLMFGGRPRMNDITHLYIKCNMLFFIRIFTLAVAAATAAAHSSTHFLLFFSYFIRSNRCCCCSCAAPRRKTHRRRNKEVNISRITQHFLKP